MRDDMPAFLSLAAVQLREHADILRRGQDSQTSRTRGRSDSVELSGTSKTLIGAIKGGNERTYRKLLDQITDPRRAKQCIHCALQILLESSRNAPAVSIARDRCRKMAQ